jgi:hypothetical protein
MTAKKAKELMMISLDNLQNMDILVKYYFTKGVYLRKIAV